MSKWSIKAFELPSDFKIAVTFADRTSGIVDLSPRLDYGALTWPGGIDLAPDAMYERIRESGISVVAAKSKIAA